MHIDFSNIFKLKKTREQIARLQDQEKELMRPMFDDYGKIQKVYDVFREVLSERDCPPSHQSVYQRKKFLFIVLYLFAPGVLIGDYMPKGLRKVLSDTLDIKSETTISNNCEDIVFLFRNYKDFSSDINELYHEMIKRL